MSIRLEGEARAQDRGALIGTGLAWLATWSLRLLLVAGGAVLLGLVVGELWVVVLPVLLAMLLASVLWPACALLRRRGVPPALAAAGVLVGGLVLIVGGLSALAPIVTSQVGDLAQQASSGLRQVQEYVTGPPLNLAQAQVDDAVSGLTDRLQDSASRIATGVLSGVSAVTSGLVTFFLTLVLTFFFLKDGPRFLPWLGLVLGRRASRHLEVVLTRSWGVLGSFVQGQAAVGAVDGVLIGIGLALLGVPLALPLGVLTFFGGFIPIVGAFVAGALAVLVALVANGPTTALIVVGLIVLVQQIEGNVLQPALQGKTLRLHPGVVLLAVTAGGTIFGIAGAFLSVPFVAVLAVVLRYLGDVLQERSGEPQPDAGADPPEPSPAEPGAGDVAVQSAVDVPHDEEQRAEHGGQVGQGGAGQQRREH